MKPRLYFVESLTDDFETLNKLGLIFFENEFKNLISNHKINRRKRVIGNRSRNIKNLEFSFYLTSQLFLGDSF